MFDRFPEIADPGSSRDVDFVCAALRWLRSAGAALTAMVLIPGCSSSSPERSGATSPLQVVGPQPPPMSCHARGSGLFSLPDARCTPGAINPAVTQANIHSTICREGYSDAVRPPESVTEPEKAASLSAYGDPGPLRRYEYDHLIPLELGGAGNDPRNLWPEPGATPNPKDELENRLRAIVCAGEIGLAVVQRELATNWVRLYDRTSGTAPRGP